MTVGVGGSNAEAELAKIKSVRDVVPLIETEEHLRRLDRAQKRMQELGIAALWLDGTTNLQYFTGVKHGQTERMIGALVTAEGEVAYLSPAFEVEKLKTLMRVGQTVHGWEEDESPYALFVEMLRERNITSGTIAIDDHARFFVTEGIRAQGGDWRYIASGPVASWCRQRKTDHEIALMRHAMETTVEIQAAAARILQPGIMTTEVQSFLDRAHHLAGFEGGCPFASVLFGKASAYPHGVPYAQSLEEGDMVLMDCGAPMHGYMSDITRSFVFGTPTDRQRSVWDLDKEAQAAGFAAAKPGAPAGGIDDACRGVIERAGFGPGYKVPGLPHRTGHGIGMDVHEEPYFVKGNPVTLDAGMCGSIEPTIAIYGEFGIRLEDHIFMTDRGAEWFTKPAHSVDDPFGVDVG